MLWTSGGECGGWLKIVFRFAGLSGFRVEGSIGEIRDAMNKKRAVTIKRDPSAPDGTFGVLTVGDSGFSCYTGEIQWLNNERGFSCIPEGSYECAVANSPKFGAVYHLVEVPGRSEILIHKGNYVGDWGRGLKSDSEGCILLGRAIGEIAGQKALLSSRDALLAFMAEMENEPFTLKIVNGEKK